MKIRILMLVLLAFLPLIARAETGVVVGRIVDANGVAASGARVAVTGLDGRVVTETTTDASGDFSFSAPPGEYRLEVSRPGAPTLRRDVRVTSGIGRLSLAFGSATLLDAEFLRTLSDHESEFRESLVGTGDSAGNAGISGPIPLILGSPDFIIDGEPGRLPPVDQVKEVSIASNPFTAEFRLPGLARIDVTTSDDRQSLHGTATFNFRDDSMAARNALTGFRSRSQVRYLHGILDGPLFQGRLRDRLFSSITAQRRSEDGAPFVIRAVTSAGPVNESVPNTFTDQAFGTRTQYILSDRHTLNLNLRGGSLVTRNIGVGLLNLQERGSTQTIREWDFGLRETSRINANTFHEVRFQIERNSFNHVPVTEGVSINVVDNFNGGGASSAANSVDTVYQLGNVLSWVRPSRVYRAGVQGRHHDSRGVTENNLRGTFTFLSLSDYLAGTPVQFTQTIGSSTSRVKESGATLFAQSDWTVRPRLSLSMGLRYEVQSTVDDFNNVAPRAGVAYQVRPSIAIRGGIGVFHQLLPADISSSLSLDTGRSMIFITNPSYPDPFAPGVSPTVLNLSNPSRQKAHDLANPYLIHTGISVEKRLESDTAVSVSYDHIRGNHQIRRRNINAPYPGILSGDLINRLNSNNLSVRNAARAEVDLMRPFYPIVGTMTQYESAGSLLTRAISVRFRGAGLRVPGVFLQWTGGYTIGWSEDDDSVAASSYDLRAEWARSSLFPRHHVWSGLMARVRWGIAGSLFFTGRSGYPYNITTGRDENGDGAANDRPAGVPRNSEMGARHVNLDARLAKTIALPVGLDSRLALTAFVYGRNVLNSTHHATPVGNLGAFNFGLPTHSSFSRQLEVGGKLSF